MQYWYITGTGSGLGNAIAQAVLMRGNTKVFGLSRHQTISHPNYVHHIIDLSDLEQTKKFKFEPFNKNDQVVLINNAGSLGKIGFVGNVDDETIIETYNLNCISPHILMGKFIAEYSGWECKKVVINVSSGAATTPYDGWGIYCASKSALEMLTLCVAKEQELILNNIKFFSVAPGVMDTAMQEQIRNIDPGVFSRREKFVDLNNNKQLYDVHAVAEKYLEIVDNAYTMKETIQRIVL